MICFDLDGTLIEATKAHWLAYKKALIKNGIKDIDEKKIVSLFGVVSKVFLKKVYPHMDDKMISKISLDHDKILWSDTKRYLKLLKGVKVALKKLSKNHKLAIASNCRKKTIINSLKAVGIDRKLFSAIVGNDEVKRPKPQPDEILRAEYLVKLNADYMVGDTVYDIIAGKRAKAKTVAVLSGNHSRAKLKKYKPTLIIKSVADLPKYIK